MSTRSVVAMYFSPTGTTRRIVSRVAQAVSDEVCQDNMPAHRNFTLPSARNKRASFLKGDVVVCGVPVHAGRVPKIPLEHIRAVDGNGALAIAVVVYGNRDYDDALIELADLLETRGFIVVAAAAFIGEHSFSATVAQARPDDDDMALATEFATRVSRKIRGNVPIEKVVPKGNRPYRDPPVWRNEKGETIDSRNARPQTSPSCQNCNTCVDVCPTGSIVPDDVSNIGAGCIRCNACVKTCPSEAKYFSDSHYLTAKRWLEAHCVQRRTPEFFL